MAERPSIKIGNVNGGQNNFGGDHNTFNQQVNGLTATQVADLLGRVRNDLGAFPDPVAAARTLDELQAAPAAELTRTSRFRTLLEDLKEVAGPSTDALAALTALIAAIHGVVG
ncbi:hypothetical protein [Actinoplanes sp. HUAS TT8]|uniref:hypothetical protein n=1 Tax=Actinoplanes sp. HUAS TT8 TaxID=3447453 RepID=UPI003F52444E